MKCIDIYSSFRFCQQVNEVDFYFADFIFSFFRHFHIEFLVESGKITSMKVVTPLNEVDLESELQV